jgi:transcription attenuation protein (tryptophan RNA-binding attenuator protein)
MEKDTGEMATEGQTGADWRGAGGRYVVVKALEDGVIIMGLTRGRDTRSHHSERLDAGEVLVAQFTDLTAAIKIRGRAEIMTDVGTVSSGPER